MGGRFLSFVNIGPKVRLGRCFCFLLLVLFVSWLLQEMDGCSSTRTISWCNNYTLC